MNTKLIVPNETIMPLRHVTHQNLAPPDLQHKSINYCELLRESKAGRRKNRKEHAILWHVLFKDSIVGLNCPIASFGSSPLPPLNVPVSIKRVIPLEMTVGHFLCFRGAR